MPMQDLAPDHALELLALPVTPENAGQRAKGVTLLRGALRRCSQEQSPELNEQVMRAIGKAKDTMTAAEQVSTGGSHTPRCCRSNERASLHSCMPSAWAKHTGTTS